MLPEPRTRQISRTILVTALLVAAAPSFADPFPTRDQNPLLLDYGLPVAMPSRLAPARTWTIAADLNWGSSAIGQAAASEALLVDAETREVRITAAHALSDSFSIRLQLPYRYVGSGVLDGFIDRWHDSLSLPEGARRSLPKDQVHIQYWRNGATLLEQRASEAGVGNMVLDIGYQWLATERTSVATWLSVKLPTSSFDGFAHDTVDATWSAAGKHDFANRWSIFGQGGVNYLEEDPRLNTAQRNIAWHGMIGISVRTWRSLELKVQVDAHSVLLDDAHLDFLGGATILTLGGSYELQSGWLIDIGVSEDIDVDASPDVVFVIGLRHAFVH